VRQIGENGSKKNTGKTPEGVFILKVVVPERKKTRRGEAQVARKTQG